MFVCFDNCYFHSSQWIHNSVNIYSLNELLQQWLSVWSPYLGTTTFGFFHPLRNSSYLFTIHFFCHFITQYHWGTSLQLAFICPSLNNLLATNFAVRRRASCSWGIWNDDSLYVFNSVVCKLFFGLPYCGFMFYLWVLCFYYP